MKFDVPKHMVEAKLEYRDRSQKSDQTCGRTGSGHSLTISGKQSGHNLSQDSCLHKKKLTERHRCRQQKKAKSKIIITTKGS